MVLHITGAADILGMGRTTLKFREDGGKGFAHKVGEHVKAPAMRHADHDLLKADLGAAPKDLLQGRHGRFATVEPKTLGPGVLLVEELLEGLCRGQLIQYPTLLLRRELRMVALGLHALLDPGFLGRVLDVHELYADVPAIGPPEDGVDFAQCRRLEPKDVVDENRPVHIGIAKAV